MIVDSEKSYKHISSQQLIFVNYAVPSPRVQRLASGQRSRELLMPFRRVIIQLGITRKLQTPGLYKVSHPHPYAPDNELIEGYNIS